jgi:hypothetical protein
MLSDSFALLSNYTYIILSGLIGYIIWKKYFSENEKKKLKDNIDNQLEWINVSILVFFNLITLLFFIISINLLSNNDQNSLFQFISEGLENIHILLIYLFGILSVLMYKSKGEKMIPEMFLEEQKNVFLIFLLLFIIISSFFYIYEPTKNYGIFIFLSISLLGIIFWFMSSFEYKVSFKSIFYLIGLYILIMIVTLTITKFILINSFDFISEENNLIICDDDYYDCYENIIHTYHINHKYVTFYNLEYIDNPLYKIENIYFENDKNKSLIYMPREIYESEDKKIKNINVVKIDQNDNKLSFYLNQTVRKNISKIRIQFKKDINYKNIKPILFDSHYKNNKLNINITKNTTKHLEFYEVEINDLPYNQNCSFLDEDEFFEFRNKNTLIDTQNNIKFFINEIKNNHLEITGEIREKEYFYQISIVCNELINNSEFNI